MELNMLNLEKGYSVTQPGDSVGSIVQWGNELRKVQSTVDRRRGWFGRLMFTNEQQKEEVNWREDPKLTSGFN